MARIHFNDVKTEQGPTNAQVVQSVNHLQTVTGKRYLCVQKIGKDTIILMEGSGHSTSEDVKALNDDIAMIRTMDKRKQRADENVQNTTDPTLRTEILDENNQSITIRGYTKNMDNLP